jgi:hypothetical protein
MTMTEWLGRVSQRPVNRSITRESRLEALDEIFGPWPGEESSP